MELMIVTGHTAGLGRAIYQAAQGTDRALLGLARRQLGQKSPWARELSVDLSAALPWEDAIDQAVDDWAQDWKRIVLINNAGTIFPLGPTEALDGQDVEAAYRINVVAPLRLFAWVLRRFHHLPQRLVAISSGAAIKAYPAWAVYCSSKAALRMQAQVIAAEMELRGRDVKVLSYAPGILDGTMQEQIRLLDPDYFPPATRFRDVHARGELVSPDASALELLELLDRPQASAFREIRYGDAKMSP